VSRWEINYMVGLQQLYLQGDAPAAPPGAGGADSAIFEVLLHLAALGAAVRTSPPDVAEVARAAAAVNSALAVVLFDDAGVSSDDSVALLGELQEQHLAGWSGRFSLVGRERSSPKHLLNAFRSLVALEEVLAGGDPDPSAAEGYAATLANSVMFIAFDAGVFATPGAAQLDSRAVAEAG
jgi:hypothetical protein